MRYLGLDQATKVTGYAVFDDSKLVESGILEIPNAERFDIGQRFYIMSKKISTLVEKVKPDLVAIEDIQFQRNFLTYQKLANFQGIVFQILFERDIPYTIVEPSKWKSFLNVRGKKREEQKQDTIKKIHQKFGVSAKEDESDAIGIAWWTINNCKGGKI